MREQRLHDIGVLLSYRPHKRRLGAGAASIHVGPFGDQLFDDARIARASGHHQRRLAGQERRVRVRPGFEQASNHRRASIQAGRPERRDAKIVRGVHLGSGANQQAGAFHIVPVARPMKGRRAIRFGGIDLHLFLKQGA